MSIHISRNSLTENDIKILEKNYILQKKRSSFHKEENKELCVFKPKIDSFL